MFMYIYTYTYINKYTYIYIYVYIYIYIYISKFVSGMLVFPLFFNFFNILLINHWIIPGTPMSQQLWNLQIIFYNLSLSNLQKKDFFLMTNIPRQIYMYIFSNSEHGTNMGNITNIPSGIFFPTVNMGPT